MKETIIEKFAGPYDRGEYSPSVQKTLYETQVLVLDRVPEVGPHLDHKINTLTVTVVTYAFLVTASDIYCVHKNTHLLIMHRNEF